MDVDAVARSLDAARERLQRLCDCACEAAPSQAAALDELCAELTILAGELGSAQQIAAHLDTVVTQMPAGVVVAAAPGGEAILINDEARRITGDQLDVIVPVERYNTVGSFTLLHQDGRPYRPEEWPIARAVRNGEIIAGEEIDLLRADGSHRTIVVNAAPIRDAHDNIVAGVVTFHDDTERRRGQQAVEESEQRLRLAFSAARMGYWDWNIADGTISWSIEHNGILDLPLDQRSGSLEEILARVHPDDRAALRATIERSIAQHEAYHQEYRVVRRDATVAWAAGSGRPIYSADGTPVRMIGVVRDITARRRATEAMRLLAEAGATLAGSLDYETTLAQLARLLVRTLADFCVIDLLDETGRPRRVQVTFADPARAAEAEAIRDTVDIDWAAPHAEAVRRGEAVLLPEYDDAALHSISPDAARRAGACASGVRSTIIVPLRAREQTIGALTLCAVDGGRRYDEHDLDLAQELARRAALAVDSARLYRDARAGVEARDAFLSMASHELKTPLTSLLGYAYLLENSDPSLPDSAERSRRAGDIIKRQSQRLNALIDNMLDLSRLQQGQFAIVRAPLDLAQLLRRVVDELRLTLTQHQLSLSGADEPLAMEGDEARLEQVFQNLIGNAIKYSPGGGLVSVQLARDEQSARVTVVDQGIGIPEDALGRLFTPFFRAANVGQGSSGFGIGLYIVDEIVRRHGGAVGVRSKQGAGSTFEVSLPVAPML